MPNISLFAVLLAALSMTACTAQFNAVRIKDVNTSVPPAGAPYNLTFSQYDIQITQRLTACYDKKRNLTNETGAAKYDLSNPKVKVTVAATISKAEVRDPDQTYVIDLGSLQSFFKTTDIKVSYYDNGAIKSINAEADDKTGEFIAGTAQTILKLAAAGGAQSLEKCREEAWKTMLDIETETDLVDKLALDIATSTEELKQFLSVASALGRATPKRSRDAVAAAVEKLNKQLAEQKLRQQSLRDKIDTISVSTKEKWPTNGTTFVSAKPLAEPVDPKVYNTWVEGPNETARLSTSAYFAIAPMEPIGRRQPCKQDCVEDAISGLKYRMPALGKLHMCGKLSAVEADPSVRGVAAGTSYMTCDSADSKLHKIDSKPEMISQLGRIYSLPLRSVIFSKKSIAATFSENGVPTQLGAISTAGSEKLASTFGTVADAAIAYNTSKLGREKAALENQLAIGKLRKDIAALEPIPLAPPPKDQARLDAIAEFSGEAALLKAEIAAIEAHNALRDLNKLSTTVN